MFELLLGITRLSIAFFIVKHVPLDRSRKNIQNKKRKKEKNEFISNGCPEHKLLIFYIFNMKERIMKS